MNVVEESKPALRRTMRTAQDLRYSLDDTW